MKARYRSVALMAASFVAAVARMRIAALATAENFFGSVIEACAGQRIMTTEGMSAGLTSSIVKLSAGVIWPEASSVTLDMEILLPFASWWISLARRELQLLAGRSTDTSRASKQWLIDLGLPSLLQTVC